MAFRLGSIRLDSIRLAIIISLVGPILTYERMYIDGHYCYSITCRAGEEPVPCNADDERSATCQPCPAETFSDGRTRLGERCIIKTYCVDDHMVVEDEGSPMSDRICGCEDGYRFSLFVHKCYPVPRTAPKTAVFTQTATTTRKTTPISTSVKYQQSMASTSNVTSISTTAIVLPSLSVMFMGLRWRFGSINDFLQLVSLSLSKDK